MTRCQSEGFASAAAAAGARRPRHQPNWFFTQRHAARLFSPRSDVPITKSLSANVPESAIGRPVMTSVISRRLPSRNVISYGSGFDASVSAYQTS